MLPSYRIGAGANIECEVLIIGSGAGGGTLADALVAAGRDVLVLEEGPYRPAAKAPESLTESILTMWRNGGLTAGLGKTPVSYVEGSCVGGGTEINSAIMQRIPDELLDGWQQKYKIKHFNANALRPFYDQAEEIVNASITGGDLGRASDILREAGEKLGWEVTALKRAQKYCVGTNLCAAACPTGAKQSMTATTIARALDNGLRMIAECRVTKLHIKNSIVTQVSAMAKDADGRRHPVTIRAKHVICSAGAIHTPALLQRSGITGNIGTTLRMHPTIKVMAEFEDVVDAEYSRLPLYAITEFMPDIRLGGSLSLPGFFGGTLAEDWDARRNLWGRRAHIGNYYAMVRGQTMGQVKSLPGFPDPLVRYDCNFNDKANLQKGLGYLAEAMFAAGAKRVLPSIRGHAGWTKAEDAKRDLQQDAIPFDRTSLMTIHLFSSCIPGETPFCATDSFGRVRGIKNLSIADASQIPEAPGVNPQLSIMAMALRHAAHFLAGDIKA